MTTGASDENNKSVLKTEMSNPAGRPGKDTDMAATVLFLAGPGGAFYNEQVLYPDGGMIAHPAHVGSDTDSFYRQHTFSTFCTGIKGSWRC